MKYDKIMVKSGCKACSTPSIAYKLDRPLSKDILASLVSGGLIESPNFTRAGILYVENEGIVISGAFGSNNLQTKCKKKECQPFINNIEDLLSKI